MRGLSAALCGRTSSIGLSIEDCVQEVLIKILDNFTLFEGRAASPPGRRKSLCARASA
jgi:DNA-directed RNA polymerase specialized sigma24 family protein